MGWTDQGRGVGGAEHLHKLPLSQGQWEIRVEGHRVTLKEVFILQ